MNSTSFFVLLHVSICFLCAAFSCCCVFLWGAQACRVAYLLIEWQPSSLQDMQGRGNFFATMRRVNSNNHPATFTMSTFSLWGGARGREVIRKYLEQCKMVHVGAGLRQKQQPVFKPRFLSIFTFHCSARSFILFL